MDRIPDRDVQFLALPTACAELYAQITGVMPDPRDPTTMQKTLNDVAHALSNLSPIYAKDPDLGVPQPISSFDLLGGHFVRGAHVFVTRDGDEFRGLCVQRRDVHDAVLILKSAQVRFRAPPA